MQNTCEILRLRACIFQSGQELAGGGLGVVLGGECRVNTLHHECQGVRSCRHMWTLDNQPPHNIRTKQQHAEIEVETWRGGESQPHCFIMVTMGI